MPFILFSIKFNLIKSGLSFCKRLVHLDDMCDSTWLSIFIFMCEKPSNGAGPTCHPLWLVWSRDLWGSRWSTCATRCYGADGGHFGVPHVARHFTSPAPPFGLVQVTKCPSRKKNCWQQQNASIFTLTVIRSVDPTVSGVTRSPSWDLEKKLEIQFGNMPHFLKQL